MPRRRAGRAAARRRRVPRAAARYFGAEDHHRVLHQRHRHLPRRRRPHRRRQGRHHRRDRTGRRPGQDDPGRRSRRPDSRRRQGGHRRPEPRSPPATSSWHPPTRRAVRRWPTVRSFRVERTAVPVEWDEVKTQLTRLATDLGPQQRRSPARRCPGSSTARPTQWTATARSCARRWPSCPALGRILADGSGNIVDVIKNLQTFVTALRDSNQQIVEFQRPIRHADQRGERRHPIWTRRLTDLSSAVGDVQRFVAGSRDQTVEQVQRLTNVTQNLVDHRIDLENLLHAAPNAFANAYNIYNPDTGSQIGTFVLNNFSNPMALFCSAIGCRRERHRSRDREAVRAEPGSGAELGRTSTNSRSRSTRILHEVDQSGPPHLLRTRASHPAVPARNPVRPRYHPRSRRIPDSTAISRHPPASASRPRWPRPDRARPPARRTVARAVSGCTRPGAAEPARPAAARRRDAAAVIGHDRQPRRLVAIGLCVALTSTGCAFEGVNSLPLPGAVGRGSDASVYHVQFANIGTLESNSPVLIDDVVVGSVGTMTFSNWHVDVDVSVRPDVVGARQRGRQRRSDQPARLHARRARPAARRNRHEAGSNPAPPSGSATSPPTRRPSRRCPHCRPSSTVADSARSATSSTTSPPRCPAAQGDVRDLLTRLDTSSERSTASATTSSPPSQALNRLAGTLADQRDVISEALKKIPPALDVLIRERPRITTALDRLRVFSDTGNGLVNDTQADLVKNLQNLRTDPQGAGRRRQRSRHRARLHDRLPVRTEHHRPRRSGRLHQLLRRARLHRPAPQAIAVARHPLGR